MNEREDPRRHLVDKRRVVVRRRGMDQMPQCPENRDLVVHGRARVRQPRMHRFPHKNGRHVRETVKRGAQCQTLAQEKVLCRDKTVIVGPSN
ncbi:hypothetical protein PsorP6_000856 [Peronosclerospora sorghi]|uniref:Uncharacterized protein n=1 Tax=Peronosclerospora sorghi TaxID=230839 RepID=A0ACC0WXC3_9STRA|nr:hypothetical protein PsorP6_000856 [Peronosclerospora sorghi]